jgi:thiamine biosynthesis lipoprotein
LLLFFMLGGASCSKYTSETAFALGTVCKISLYEAGAARLYTTLFDRLAEIENILSVNKNGSDIDLVNQNAGKNPVKVHPELIETLKRALFFAEMTATDGVAAFDPTIGPLVQLWGIGTDGGGRVPEAAAIAEALSRVDWREVEVNEAENTVYLRKSGMALDLGGIAKGYAADALVKIIRDRGFTRAVIDLGGNIYACGERRAGPLGLRRQPWRVGVQNPLGARGTYLGVAEVSDKTLVTSGVYERFFENDGKRYHHILSTETGAPVWNGLLSVTIIAGNSMDADALSTAAFALGPEKARALLAAFPEAGAIFVLDDRSVIMTSGLEPFFRLEADWKRTPVSGILAPYEP